jgi:hypothetical protein
MIIKKTNDLVTSIIVVYIRSLRLSGIQCAFQKQLPFFPSFFSVLVLIEKSLPGNAGGR